MDTKRIIIWENSCWILIWPNYSEPLRNFNLPPSYLKEISHDPPLCIDSFTISLRLWERHQSICNQNITLMYNVQYTILVNTNTNRVFHGRWDGVEIPLSWTRIFSPPPPHTHTLTWLSHPTKATFPTLVHNLVGWEFFDFEMIFSIFD